MNKIAAAVSLLGLVAVAGCQATQDSNPQIASGQVDSAIFQPGMSTLSGGNIGLVGTKQLALTFDDGPAAGNTDRLLDYLKEQGVQATFFMVGKNIPGNEYLLERMSEDGMSLGNHTYSHDPIVKMSKSNMNGVYHEIADDDVLISPHLRDGKHIFFRSPGGSWTNLIAQAMNAHPDLRDKYIGPVFWDIGGNVVFNDSSGTRTGGTPVKYDSTTGIVHLEQRNKQNVVIRRWTTPSTQLAEGADWDCWAMGVSIEMCADGYVNEINRRQGGIVLLHDTHAKTIEMVKVLIPRLKALGYTFITMDQIPNIGRFE